MLGKARAFYGQELSSIKSSGLYKDERIITGAQGAVIDTVLNKGVINMCANNYLGLAGHPKVLASAKESLDKWGYGLSSVRFICGTQEIHKVLERRISEFLGTEGTILYSSCFDANGGLFETLLSDQDAVISDELNHASIIDGIRLCKAARFRYKNNDMEDLEEKLKETQNMRFRMIATDGVFSMDGIIADLKQICMMVDDSHAAGFIGPKGRGTHEYHEVMDRVDIITGTLGKALGGASGGYASGRKEIIELLRQRSRPYLFSNTLSPVIAAASIQVLDLLTASTYYRDRLEENTKYFREEIFKAGFQIKEGIHPIVPIMLGEAKTAAEMSERLLAKGVYAVGFSYPVVPKGKARIRVQLSAAHSIENLAFAVRAFKEAKEEMGL